MPADNPTPPASKPENEQPQVVAPPISPVGETEAQPATASHPSATTPPAEMIEPSASSDHPDASTAKWVVIIVILLLLVIAMVGALVLYLTQLKQPQPPILSPQAISPTISVSPTPSESADPVTQQLETTSDSDRLEMIEQDLDQTELDNLTQELEEIEKALP